MELYGKLFKTEVRLKELIDKKVPQILIKKARGRRSYFEGRIQNFELSQRERDMLKYEAYAEHLKKTSSDFRDCIHCAHLDTSKEAIEREFYQCTKLEKECSDIMNENNQNCPYFDKVDMSHLHPLQKSVMDFVESSRMQYLEAGRAIFNELTEYMKKTYAPRPQPRNRLRTERL